MAEAPARESPLASLEARARPAEGAGVRLVERPHAGKVGLRGEPTDEGFMAGAGRALGMVLPREANTSARRDEVAALWLGPNEWLLVCPPGTEGELGRSIADALAGVHAAVTDLTDSRTIIRMSGPNVRDLLAKGCALDLHPCRFPAGCVAQSVLAKVDVILHRVAEPGGEDDAVFDLYVGRSFAAYLWLWLADAAGA